MVVLLLHEFTEVDWLGLSTWVGTTTTSDWLIHLLIIEITKALLAAKVRPVHISARTERHHEALDVSLIDSILLLHFLQQLVILGLLLQEYNPLLVISLPAL
jgi:hypothetical protein